MKIWIGLDRIQTLIGLENSNSNFDRIVLDYALIQTVHHTFTLKDEYPCTSRKTNDTFVTRIEILL